MKKLLLALTTTTLIGSTNMAVAEKHKHDHDAAGNETTIGEHVTHQIKHEELKRMDANGDNMVSREEYMAHHEKNFDRMEKNDSDMIDVRAKEEL